jgi:hypothetical protein
MTVLILFLEDFRLLDVDLSQTALMSNLQMLDLSSFEGMPIPWDNTHPIRVHGDRIDACDDEIGLFYLPGSPRSS